MLVRLARNFILASIFITPAVYAETSIHSVCDVLDHRLEYDDKSVIVFGHVAQTMEGGWLTDDCGGKLLINGSTWTYNIWLTAAGSNTPTVPTLPSGFHWDRKTLIEALPKNADAASLGDDPDCERATGWIAVFGRFETQKTFSTVAYPSGEIRNIGYGHLGGSPAQLVSPEGGRFCLVSSKDKFVIDPALNLWMRIRTSLRYEGLAYFESDMKGALVPGPLSRVRKLKGIVVSSLPSDSPDTLILRMKDAQMPEVTLKLNPPAGNPIPSGTTVEFEGIAANFSLSPFMLTFDVPLKELITTAAK
jgi:hypothetical protein